MPETPRPGRRPRGDVGLLVVAAVATGAGTLCYLLKGSEVFLTTLDDDLRLLVSILPKLLAGVLLSGLLTVLLPHEKVARWMGARSGLRGLVVAGAAGALLPGGAMMVFPLTVALRTAGADIGTTVAFLAGWSLLNLSRTLVWEMSFFPHDFVLLRYGVSLMVPVLLGFAVRVVFAREARGNGIRNESGGE